MKFWWSEAKIATSCNRLTRWACLEGSLTSIGTTKWHNWGFYDWHVQSWVLCYVVFYSSLDQVIIYACWFVCLCQYMMLLMLVTKLHLSVSSKCCLWFSRLSVALLSLNLTYRCSEIVALCVVKTGTEFVFCWFCVAFITGNKWENNSKKNVDLCRLIDNNLKMSRLSVSSGYE